MGEVEIDGLDRLYDLVKELLGDGEKSHEIRDTVGDAIREWRQEEDEKKERVN